MQKRGAERARTERIFPARRIRSARDFVDQSAVYLRQDKAQRHILVGRIQQRGGKRNLRARKAVSHIRGENQQLARELLIAQAHFHLLAGVGPGRKDRHVALVAEIGTPPEGLVKQLCLLPPHHPVQKYRSVPEPCAGGYVAGKAQAVGASRQGKVKVHLALAHTAGNLLRHGLAAQAVTPAGQLQA